MEVKTDRYRFTIEEINEGGPAGFESVYLMSEGDPAEEDLYQVLDKFKGQLLPARNKIIRQRNGVALTQALKEDRPLGVASGFKPSGAYHFGHKLASAAVSFFQKNGVQAFIPVADIECAMDTKLSKDQYEFWAADNLLDWGANGVNLDAAHVYLQSEEFRVNTLSYITARGLSFNLAADIYGAKKLIDNFPFLFAGITQVGDILLPQHEEFGNEHSFMVSGQDQDGHMKMTVALARATLDMGSIAGIRTVPSGFYIPHIRGISGDKASSSKSEGTLYLGAGPNIEDLTDRIRSTFRKLDKAKSENLEKCSLDMVRYIDFFNSRSKVPFEDLCLEARYKELTQALEVAATREEQQRIQNGIDGFFIKHCKDQKQDNTEIIRDSLPEALVEHQRRREAILNYAKSRGSFRPSGGWGDMDDDRPTQPDFWKVPNRAVVDESKRNATQWFHIIDRASDRIIP